MSFRSLLKSSSWILVLALSFTWAPWAQTLEIEFDLAATGGELISEGDQWSYFKGEEAPSDPDTTWKEIDFDANHWLVGASGFGYDDGDDKTELLDMEDNYLSVFIRKEFTINEVPTEGRLILEVNYDDGFVCYLNGVEVEKQNIVDDPVTFETEADDPHEADSFERFDLGLASELLQNGKNVLALSGHNTSLGSSDFTLIPILKVESGGAPTIFQDGNRWISTRPTLSVTIRPEDNDATQVRIDGQSVNFDESSGAFIYEADLEAGLNSLNIESLNDSGEVVENESLELIYLAEDAILGGELTEDTTWSQAQGAFFVTSDVIVPDGISLTIEEGLTFYFEEDVSIFVFGSMSVNGTETNRVRFTSKSTNELWGMIVFDNAETAQISHALIEYSSSTSEYDGKDYFGAVEAINCALVIEHTTFQNLPVSSSSDAPQGDAITVIENATGKISHCQFLSIGEGIHSDQCYVRIEHCYFEDITGDNDGIDLEGESDPPCEVLFNTFIGADDDAINPTGSSARIIGNYIEGCRDHGMVLRNKAFPYVENNILVDCRAAGIAIENQNEALLINNTIVRCGRGLRLFDLGRPELDPGGGIGTAINCIIWDCPSPVTIEDDSILTATYCIIEGDEPWPGEGNSNEDPMFISDTDFRLQAGSPAINAGTEEDAPAVDRDGNSRPCGGGIDMGAYEYDCDDPPPPPENFIRGDANEDGVINLGDVLFKLSYLFLGAGPIACEKPLDFNDDEIIDLADVLGSLTYQFLGGAPPAHPFPNCGEDGDDGLQCSSFNACP